MRRNVIVGDVHGCRDELVRLLDRVGLGEGDQLILVGDLVARGPDPAATIDLLLKLGARSARGNHDDRVAKLRGDREGQRNANDAHRAVAGALKARHWDYLESLPLWIDLDERLRVIHAGLVPGVPIERQEPRTLMYVRSIGPRGEPVERRGERPWGSLYEGPPHVVFGHNAQEEPQIHPWATGLDTGAVYGGRLTALVLPVGEPPPPPADRRDALVSVRARRAYFNP